MDIIRYNRDKLSGSVLAWVLVGYLKFYGIGAELIEEGTGNLKPDKEEAAQKVLAHYLYYCCPPASQTV
ncbi:hypothetical protein FRC11_011857 [Ceratobasidium sp. 423]|nr:hypothetical protein FRC11_011857 [Ceratobasidium sp. 423]